MRYFFSLLVFIISNVTLAQPVKISGKVTDSMARPVPLVVIQLFESGSTTSIYKTISDSTGIFHFTLTAARSYYIHAEAVGFEIFTSNAITVHTHQPNLLLPDYVLRSKVFQLQNVTITGTRPIISSTGDKIIYNVQDDKSLAALSALDALSKVPFVAVDGLGNVQLKGQSNFRILLNGRPTSLFASNPGEALKGFPASTISKIEVITNPSAKYEGEGLSGLINIITTKKTIGFNGSASFTYSNIQDGNINPNNRISFRSGKFGINSFVYYAENLGFKTTGFNEYNARTNGSPFSKRRSADTLQNAGYQYGGNLEFAYDIDSLHSISLYGVLFGSGSKRDQINRFELTNSLGSVIEQNNFFTTDTSTNLGSEVGIDYIKKFRENKKEFSISANRQFRKALNDLFSEQFDSNNQMLYLKNNNKAKNEQVTIQSDYALPSGANGILEIGINFIRRKVVSEYTSSLKTQPGNPYIPNPGNNNEFRYKQNIYGGYVVYGYRFKNVNIKLGSRLERTIVRGDFISTLNKVEQDYYSVLPSASIDWRWKDGYRMNFSYNRRLSRPSLLFLNPFIDNRDTLFLSFGNPSLNAEYSDNIELGFSGFKQKLSYSVNLSTALVNDGIQRYFKFDPNTGITRQTYDNVGLSRLIGMNGFISFRPKKFSYSFNYNLTYAWFRNQLNTREINKGWYGSVSHAINYVPSARWFFFNNISYTGAPLQLQGRNSDFLSYNIGTGYYLIPQKMFLALGMNNFFNEKWTLKNRFSSPVLSQTTYLDRPIRSFSVTIRYNYGKLKQAVSRKKGVMINDTKENLNSQ